jgi:asparagine synthase (glutamine-hydrolysing)
MATTGKGFFNIGQSVLPAPMRKLLPDMLRRLAAGEELFWSGAFIFDETQKQHLLTPQAISRIKSGNEQFSSHQIIQEDLQRLLAAKPHADQLERMTYLELKLRLAELLLMRVDKMTMANSIEARVPFLDHHLIEFTMRLPRRMKYHNGETKYILKRALQGVIPDTVLQRPKRGFGVPINDWMVKRFGSFVESSILQSHLRERELFDYEYIKQLFAAHRSGKGNYSFHLWNLLNLSLWYDIWISGTESKIGSIKEAVSLSS